MLRVAEGDFGAFNKIVFRHQRFVWAVAYQFLGDSFEAENITQETFLRILEAAPSSRKPECKSVSRRIETSYKADATQSGITNKWLKELGLMSVRDIWIKVQGYA